MIRRDDVTSDGEIIESPPAPLDLNTYNVPREFKILDPTAEMGVVSVEPRPEWIATISADFKKQNDKGQSYPAVERGGIIHIPNQEDEARAPDLVAALKATEGRSLTIAFCSDDINEIIVQRFVRYSSASLDVFGDETKLTHVTATAKQGDKQASIQYNQVYAGTREYAELVKTCKAETSVLFALAEWTPEGEPRMVWSNTFGRYRIRFTGRNSIRSILGKLTEVLPLTKGRILGIPWELTLGYRDVVGPDPVKGWARHNIPVWQIAFKVPGGIKIDPLRLNTVVQRAALNAQPLRALPAPQYTIEHALLEAPMDLEDLDSMNLDKLMDPIPHCDVENYRKTWHGMVGKDPLLSTTEGRHKFVAKFTADRWPDAPARHTNSLEQFLADANEEEASALIAKAGEVLGQLENQRRAARMSTSPKPAETKSETPEPDRTTAEPEPEPPASNEPIDGSFTEMPEEPEAPPPAEPDEPDEPPSDSTSTEGPKEEPARLATDKQKQSIMDYAPPSRRASLDFDTLTFDEAALLLDEMGVR